jgi:hypothetical protein
VLIVVGITSQVDANRVSNLVAYRLDRPEAQEFIEFILDLVEGAIICFASKIIATHQPKASGPFRSARLPPLTVSPLDPESRRAYDRRHE